ncbi:hypothetical protein [Bacillus vallismortis]|uniref:hypothetical protein n=1 Tax=Bacillus vallismortis TaxID=72361 RepID=UPI000287B952|nr:hypothetical protein [Bacillus vallismortis]MBG9771402.1 hypothetical protein [Bacillus vallismortis]MCY8531853.1 hypothetical protein [Bacillus vallismortis]QAV09930.1 hypothetical protein BV11031_15675 [Bacillus vallismortis]
MFGVIILLILGLSVLAAGFLTLKRELSIESVSISSADEAKSEMKNIFNDHGWFYLSGVALFMQFVFRGFHFTFEYFFHAFLISSGIQSLFYLFNKKELGYKVCAVIVVSFLVIYL